MAMALVFVDGCSHYQLADITRKWDSGSATALSSTVRHSSGRSLEGPSALRKNVTATAELIVAGAFRAPSVAASQSIFEIADAGTTQLMLMVNAGGQVQVRRGSIAGPVLGSGASLTANTWYFLEIACLIANAGGKFDVRIHDGTGGAPSTFSLASGDTQQTANATADALILNSPSNLFSDIHLFTGTGYVVGDFFGDTKIVTLRTFNVGALTQMSIGGTAPAATNFGSMQETFGDKGTTLVSESTVGHRDLYEFDELDSTVTTVHSVAQNILWRKDDTAVRGAKTTYRDTGGVNFDSAETVLPADWIYTQRVLELNPSGSAAWTRSAVNDGFWGQVLSS